MNKAEKAWVRSIVQLGCICCILTGKGNTPAEVHHLLKGGRRMGNLYTIPLCMTHHRSGINDTHIVSRDHNQKRFEQRYGTEAYLLEKTKELVAAEAALTV